MRGINLIYQKDNCDITNNNAQFGAGLTYSASNNCSISNSQISSNGSEDSQQGGLRIGHCANLTITDSLIQDNIGASGAGLYTTGSSTMPTDVTLVNVTLTGNYASKGGGVYVNGTSSVSAPEGTIIANNTAISEGADIYVSPTSEGTVKELPNAAAMQQIYAADGRGQAITGWYSDTENDRYEPSVNGQPVESVTNLGASTALVASYTAEQLPVTPPSPGVTYYIDASAGNGGSISPSGRVPVAAGERQTFTISASEGYEIVNVLVDGESVGQVSSYTFTNVRSNHTITVIFRDADGVADPDDTGVSDWLDTDNHNAYLQGYGNNLFAPDADMTRGEVAQLFYNLLREKDVAITVSFDDVPASRWYTDAVNTLASLGIIVGAGDGNFYPNSPITRAEFTAIAMRFTKGDVAGDVSFTDVSPSSWYYRYVVGAVHYGWIVGYGNGLFAPNASITRAEVTTIANRMLGRSADEAYVDSHLSQLKQFADVTGGWAFYQIMEATNSHTYTITDGQETWTGLS